MKLFLTTNRFLIFHPLLKNAPEACRFV